jgi:3D (Asp-Asp-Asp) domain-containing protein
MKAQKTLDMKIADAKAELAQQPKKDKEGKFRKETWTERFGWYAIIWIFGWGVAGGWGYTYAYEHSKDLFGTKTITIEVQHAQASTDTPKEVKAPQTEESEAKEGNFSAYNAEIGQTDADPFTMASGKKVYEGAIANNCLDFGTKIKVNGKIKVVEDRMNSRYGCQDFDIFMTSYDEAISFGRQTISYEIL